MVSSLIAGTLLGLSAGFAPGPMLTFVITQTLKHNLKEGIKVAFTPLITDLPIILITVFALSRLQSFDFVLGIISLLGGLFVLHMAYESLKTKPIQLDIEATQPNSIKKGALINILNPHPYLFWFSVGTPTFLKAYNESHIAGLIFLASFYILLVSSKILVALVVGRSRAFLTSNVYIFVMRALGVLLFIFALMLFRDGISLFFI